MLAFYGLEAVGSETGTLIRRSPDWTTRSANWLRSGNHNHLRLTRIVKSLTLLGLYGEARALSSILLGLAVNPGLRVFSRTTIRIWRDASLEADRAAGELGTTSREREREPR